MTPRTSLVLAALVTGCAALSGPDYYKNTSTAELCHFLHTLPSANLNHPARLRELERRGHSCGSPSDVARSQQNADALYGSAINRALTPPVAPPQPVICTTSQDGRTTVCR